MRKINVLVRTSFNLWHDAYTSVYDSQIVGNRYGKHSVASAWDVNEKQEVTLRIFLVDFWSEKALSIYSIDWQLVSHDLQSLGFVDIWLEKL